jgi:hypothetical protein
MNFVKARVRQDQCLGSSLRNSLESVLQTSKRVVAVSPDTANSSEISSATKFLVAMKRGCGMISGS